VDVCVRFSREEIAVTRIKICLLALLLSLPLSGALAAGKAPAAKHKPKLILAIAIDQFRYDYTTCFRDRYIGGLATMPPYGAVFVDAHQDHFSTVSQAVSEGKTTGTSASHDIETSCESVTW